jgi:hypothetical protein
VALRAGRVEFRFPGGNVGARRPHGEQRSSRSQRYDGGPSTQPIGKHAISPR